MEGFSEGVADFYDGKSVFLTGATGFVGSTLLESLLRCCPGIQTVYILLRAKKGKDIQERKKKTLEKTLFDVLRHENPSALEKIRPVEGDISEPDFGMSPEDYDTLTREVNIVFHCAALIALNHPIELMVKRNSLSVDNVIKLCKRIKKLDVLVYTSTAYSNCNRNVIKECIYRLPFPAQKFIDALSESKEALQTLIDECHPRWPSTYTFSKCLAENLLAEKANDIPVAIVRPAIIICVWKFPLPGYVEDSSGLITLSIVAYKGFSHVAWINPNFKVHLVPADIVANAHIISAWSVATGRSISPLVVNCAQNRGLPTIQHFVRTMEGKSKGMFVPKAFSRRTDTLILTPYRPIYKLLTLWLHYFPAAVIDAILKLNGQKPKLVHLYKVYDANMETLYPLSQLKVSFENDAYEGLNKQLTPEDAEIFPTDLNHFNTDKVFDYLKIGAPFFDPKIDSKTKEQRIKITNQRFYAIRTIQTSGLLCLVGFLYLVYIFFQYVLMSG